MAEIDTSANDDLFDDQIADAVWEAASNGEGRITATGLRRELTLIGLQIISKAYHDSVTSERDQLAAKLAEVERKSVAAWMLEHSFPTGHGDTVADLLVELVGHERGACARIARDGCLVPPDGGSPTEAEADMCDRIATLILARSDEKKGNENG